jgi:hypothetical protein
MACSNVFGPAAALVLLPALAVARLIDPGHIPRPRSLVWHRLHQLRPVIASLVRCRRPTLLFPEREVIVDCGGDARVQRHARVLDFGIQPGAQSRPETQCHRHKAPPSQLLGGITSQPVATQAYVPETLVSLAFRPMRVALVESMTRPDRAAAGWLATLASSAGARRQVRRRCHKGKKDRFIVVTPVAARSHGSRDFSAGCVGSHKRVGGCTILSCLDTAGHLRCAAWAAVAPLRVPLSDASRRGRRGAFPNATGTRINRLV